MRAGHAASASPAPRRPPACSTPSPPPRARSNRPFTAADYELIQDEAALDEWIAEATRAGTVAFDCETDALDANNARLVGMSLALLEGPWGNVNSTRRRAAYLPLGHRTPTGEAQGALDLGGTGGAKDGEGELLPGQIPLEKAIAKLRPLLEDPSVLKVGQNIKYDMCVLRRHGVEVGPVDDTMLLSFVLDAGKHNHGMDELAENYLGQKTIKFADVAGSGAKQVELRQACRSTRRATTPPRTPTSPCSCGRSSSPGSPRAHGGGVRDDRAAADPRPARHGAGRHQDRRAPAQGAVLRVREAHAELEQEMHKLAGRAVQCRLAQAAGRDPVRRAEAAGRAGATRTARGRPTSAILEDLAAQGHALPVKIMEHRQIAKLKGTYTDALVRELDAEDRPRAHLLPDDRCGDRAARLDRSQPAEHPGAHRGGPQDPPGLHRREGPQAPVAPTIRRSSCACSPTSPTSPR